MCANIEAVVCVNSILCFTREGPLIGNGKYGDKRHKLSRN